MKLHEMEALLVAFLLVTPGPPCPAQKLVRPLLSISSVVTTLQHAGLAVDAQQITMPAGLTAAEEQPALAMESAELQQGGDLRIRMACVRHSACPPFYVAVSLPSQQKGIAALETLRPAMKQSESATMRNAAVIRPGEQTSLVLEDGQMRISLPVVALDSGAVGTEVRVVSLDHKTTYRTIVESSTLVRGVLP